LELQPASINHPDLPRLAAIFFAANPLADPRQYEYLSGDYLGLTGPTMSTKLTANHSALLVYWIYETIDIEYTSINTIDWQRRSGWCFVASQYTRSVQSIVGR
jgi:hypothetical protein